MVVKIAATGRNLNKQLAFRGDGDDLARVIVPINKDRPAATDVWIGSDANDHLVRTALLGIYDVRWSARRSGGLDSFSFTLDIDRISLDLQLNDRVSVSVEGPNGTCQFVGYVDSITTRWDADVEASIVSVRGYSTYNSIRFHLSGEEEFWRSTTDVLTTVPIDRSIAGYLNVVVNGKQAVDGELVVDQKGLKDYSPIKGFTHDIDPLHDVSRYKFSFDGSQWYEIVDTLVDFLNAQAGQFLYFWDVRLDAGLLTLHVGKVSSTLSMNVASAPYRIVRGGGFATDTITSYVPVERSRNSIITSYYVKTKLFKGYIPDVRPSSETLNEQFLDLSEVAATKEEITPFVDALLQLSNTASGSMELANTVSVLSPYHKLLVRVPDMADIVYDVAYIEFSVDTASGISGRISLGEDTGSLISNMMQLVKERFSALKGDTTPPNISLTTSAPTMATSTFIGSPAEFYVELADEDSGIDPASVVVKVAKIDTTQIPDDNFDPQNPLFKTVINQINWDNVVGIPAAQYVAKTYNPVTGEVLTSETIPGAFYVAVNLHQTFTSGDMVCFRAFGRDLAGNEASTEPQTFKIDKEPPVVNVDIVDSSAVAETTVKPKELLGGFGRVEIKVTDVSQLEYVRCDYNIANTVRVANGSDSTGLANLTYDAVKNVFWAELSLEAVDGPVNVKVFAKDKFGNEVIDNSLYVVHEQGWDGEPPSLSVSLEYPDDYIVQASQIGSNPVFCFKMSDTESGVKGFSMAIRKAGVSDWEWVTPASSWFAGYGYYRGYGEIPDNGIKFPQFSEQFDSEYMIFFRDHFNTELTPQEEVQFAAWLAEESGRLDRTVRNDLYYYDMRGYWKDVGAGPAPGEHYPDTYKKPSHPTFSDQSVYHGTTTAFGEMMMTWVGGTWDIGGTQFVVNSNMQRYTHPVVWLEWWWALNQQGISLVLAPTEPLNTRKYILLGSAADINWREATEHGFDKFPRGMFCFDTPYIDVGDVSITPRVGIQVELFNSGMFKSGDTCQFKFVTVDADGNFRESEERTYVIDTSAPKPTMSVEDVPDNTDDSKVSYQQVTKKFRVWINVTETSPLNRLEVHRITRYDKLSPPPQEGGTHYRTLDPTKWVVPGVTPGPNYDPVSDRYYFDDVSHNWHDKFTAWVIAEDVFGKKGYSPVNSLEGVDASAEVSGKLDSDKIKDWGSQNNDQDNASFDGSNIKAGTVYWDAVSEVPFVDHQVEQGWPDPLPPNSGWAGKRVRFGWNKVSGKLCYGWYNKAQRSSGELSGDNVIYGNEQYLFHPIFTVDENGAAVGLKTQAYFTDD